MPGQRDYNIRFVAILEGIEKLAEQIKSLQGQLQIDVKVTANGKPIDDVANQISAMGGGKFADPKYDKYMIGGGSQMAPGALRGSITGQGAPPSVQALQDPNYFQQVRQSPSYEYLRSQQARSSRESAIRGMIGAGSGEEFIASKISSAEKELSRGKGDDTKVRGTIAALDMLQKKFTDLGKTIDTLEKQEKDLIEKLSKKQDVEKNMVRLKETEERMESARRGQQAILERAGGERDGGEGMGRRLVRALASAGGITALASAATAIQTSGTGRLESAATGARNFGNISRAMMNISTRDLYTWLDPAALGTASQNARAASNVAMIESLRNAGLGGLTGMEGGRALGDHQVMGTGSPGTTAAIGAAAGGIAGFGITEAANEIIERRRALRGEYFGRTMQAIGGIRDVDISRTEAARGMFRARRPFLEEFRGGGADAFGGRAGLGFLGFSEEAMGQGMGALGMTGLTGQGAAQTSTSLAATARAMRMSPQGAAQALSSLIGVDRGNKELLKDFEDAMARATARGTASLAKAQFQATQTIANQLGGIAGAAGMEGPNAFMNAAFATATEGQPEAITIGAGQALFDRSFQRTRDINGFGGFQSILSMEGALRGVMPNLKGTQRRMLTQLLRGVNPAELMGASDRMAGVISEQTGVSISSDQLRRIGMMAQEQQSRIQQQVMSGIYGGGADNRFGMLVSETLRGGSFAGAELLTRGEMGVARGALRSGAGGRGDVNEIARNLMERDPELQLEEAKQVARSIAGEQGTDHLRFFGAREQLRDPGNLFKELARSAESLGKDANLAEANLDSAAVSAGKFAEQVSNVGDVMENIKWVEVAAGVEAFKDAMLELSEHFSKILPNTGNEEAVKPTTRRFRGNDPSTPAGFVKGMTGGN